jgi:hypothetical protein
MGGGYSSLLDLVNLEPATQRITLKWMADNGVQIGTTGTVTLPPRGSSRIDSLEIFGLTPAAGLLQGYVILQSSDGRFAGWVRFNDPQQANFGSTLALVGTSSEAKYFSQVAQNDLYFTGLAVLNPRQVPAIVTVTVLDVDGRMVATGQRTLPAEGRLSVLLPEFVGPFPPMTKGYFSVTAGQPTAAFALFGIATGGQIQCFSAIPSQLPSNN